MQPPIVEEIEGKRKIITEKREGLSSLTKFSSDKGWRGDWRRVPALLYPLGLAYLGTWYHREKVRRLTASHEPDSGRRRMYSEKNQISNLAFIYACAEILLFLY